MQLNYASDSIEIGDLCLVESRFGNSDVLKWYRAKVCSILSSRVYLSRIEYVGIKFSCSVAEEYMVFERASMPHTGDREYHTALYKYITYHVSESTTYSLYSPFPLPPPPSPLPPYIEKVRSIGIWFLLYG